MKRDGFSTSKIAAHFGLNWRTAKRLLEISEQDFQLELEKTAGRKKSLELYETFVRDKLLQHPSTSSAQMHDWLKEHHAGFPVVSQKTVFNFVLALRGKYNIPKTELVRDYCTVPELPYGQQAQVDFDFYNMTTSQGKTRKVQFFTVVLARSRFKCLLFSEVPFTSSAHERAFEAIQGCPKQIVYDQDRLLLSLKMWARSS
jgi:hypothetical protein